MKIRRKRRIEITASDSLIDNLNLMIAGPHYSKKEIMEHTGLSDEVLNDVLNRVAVKSKLVRLLFNFEIATRPDQEELIESLKKTLESGINKAKLCNEAQINRQGLDSILINERKCQARLLRKLENAVMRLEEEKQLRIEVFNLVVGVINSGATLSSIGDNCDVTYRSLFGFIYEGACIEKVTVDKLYKGCMPIMHQHDIIQRFG